MVFVLLTICTGYTSSLFNDLLCYGTLEIVHIIIIINVTGKENPWPLYGCNTKSESADQHEADNDTDACSSMKHAQDMDTTGYAAAAADKADDGDKEIIGEDKGGDKSDDSFSDLYPGYLWSCFLCRTAAAAVGQC